MKVSYCLITFLTTTNIVWSAVSRPRASAGDGVRPDATVGVGHSAGGGVRLGTKGSVGQGPDATVGLGQGAGGGASPGATVGVGQGAGGGASSGATVGVDQEPGTIVGISQGAGGGASPGTTVGVGHGAGGGVHLDTKGSVGQGPGAIVGLSQRAGGGASSSATVGLDRGARGGASSSATVGVSQGATVGVGHGAGGGASPGTTVGAGQGGGGGATLSKGGSGVVDASLGAGSSTGLATNFSSGADAVLATLTTTMRTKKSKKTKRIKKTKKKTKKITKKLNKTKLCASKGFGYSATNWCVCNFAGACDSKDNALRKDLTTLKDFAPQGVDAFKYGTQSPVTICEGSTVGILYDCDARIPLYAATVIYGANAGGKFVRADNWVYSKDSNLQSSFVANNKDYDQSSCIVYCYENITSGTLNAWDGSPCTSPNKIPVTTSIDKGHMIAARYGFGHGQTPGVAGTFTYTNAVPQIGSFNRGSWSKAEKGVIELAKRCHVKAQRKKTEYVTVGARVYVVVGVIPTSFFDQPRFFGSAKFSNFQDDVYRVLLPEIMWTAVCCIHTDGTIDEKTAFYGQNSETNHQVKYHDSASDMFKDMQKTWPTIPTITVFPGVPGCN